MFGKLLFIFVAFSGCLSEKTPSVVTKSGKIVSHYLKSYGGHNYEAYQGIPYALPPTGERRFKAPIPIPSWSGELTANHLRSSCWQLERIPFPSGKLFQGEEDCLYLNVFVPERKSNASSPVLFWIHGGSWLFGSSKPEEEAFIMDHDVILVTIQYRLGALGFLSTEDGVVSGNMGLKDQSLALKWVHDNIEYFGGDPQKITLYGHSVGGASVHYHYMSPLSAGLFQNGVSFSGTAFNWWAQTPKYPRKSAVKLGHLMNCTTSDMEEMVTCLRQRSARDIVKAQLKFMPWRLLPPATFGPVIEKSSEDSFIDESPRRIVESGKLYDAPWVTGVTSEEGLFLATESTDDEALKDFNDNWDKVASLLLGYYDTFPKKDHPKIARAIRKHYFNDKPIDRKTFMNFVHLLSDQCFYIDAENAARAQAEANESPVWFYRYSYRAVDSMTIKITNSTEYFGVCHGDDVNLFMKNNVMTPTKSSNDMLMQQSIIESLIVFANLRNPNINDVNWSKVDSKKALNYLEVGGPGFTKMTTAANFGQKKFWNSLYSNENGVRNNY